jgi:PKD repeat protein
VTVTPASSGGSPIQSVVIDYGDGSSDNLGSVTGTVSIQHVYGNEGTYTPTVTATDSTGSSTTASTVIFVQPLIVGVSASKGTTTPATTEVDFTANVSPSGSSVASYTWSFGDGTSQTTSSNQTSHTYPNAPSRTYTVRVTARLSTGNSSSGSTTVRIP